MNQVIIPCYCGAQSITCGAGIANDVEFSCGLHGCVPAEPQGKATLGITKWDRLALETARPRLIAAAEAAQRAGVTHGVAFELHGGWRISEGHRRKRIAAFDVNAEEQRLADLGQRIASTRRRLLPTPDEGP